MNRFFQESTRQMSGALRRVGCTLLTALPALVMVGPVSGLAVAAERPNVVIMLADNVGYGDLGAYGGGEVRGMPTPRIDALAQGGLRLTQFLVEPGCTPSRAALQTGRYSPRSGLGSIIIGGTRNTLQADEVTLGELFKEQGYATAYVGKWHLGASEQSWPTRQGYDQYRVGVMETTDGVLYRESMKRAGLPEQAIAAAEPAIWSSAADGSLKKVRAYDEAYRHQVEGDIAAAAVSYIREQAQKPQPFFLFVGWTDTHYPSLVAPEFEGRSRIGAYGDAVMELDHRTGQVLDAISAAGIEQNTLVIWMSDNGATPTEGPATWRGGSNGPFRGELGDALEGSLRVPAIFSWPGHIAPRVSNAMVSIHDLFPTLGRLIGARLPDDRPIDGVDQGAFLLGQQAQSARESLLTFIGDEIVAVRWRQYRIYPKQFVASAGNPSMSGAAGYRMEGAGYPTIFNIELDPREELDVTAESGWVFRPYMELITAYMRSLEKYPNPPAVNLTRFGH